MDSSADSDGSEDASLQREDHHGCVLCGADGEIQASDGWYCAECVHQRGSCCWADDDT